MTALFLANKATFPFQSHFLFPAAYQCVLHLLFILSCNGMCSKYAVYGGIPVFSRNPRSPWFHMVVIVASGVGGDGLERVKTG